MKRIILTVFLMTFLLASALVNEAKAQLIVTEASSLNEWTADSLVRNILLDNGLSISNAKFNGSSGVINCNSIGVFNTGDEPTNLGMSSGLIIATGASSGAVGPNNNGSLNLPTTCSGYQDPQLTSIASGATHDVAVLEFDFVPWSDTLSFKFVFGSEEYMEYANSQYNDVFGFFLQGQNPAGGIYDNQNMALIPRTNEVVSINNVNLNHNGQYYVDNTNGQTIQFDGFTIPLEVMFPVVPMTTYHIKFAICDVIDTELDSGVFIEAQSFTTNLAYSMTIDTLLYNDIPDDYYFCANRVIEFNTLTDWQYDDLIWYFGDGSSAVGDNVTHVYQEEGFYDVFNVLHNPHRSLDSIYLNKTIEVKSIHSESAASICRGESYEWNGNLYSESGIYIDTLDALMYCDSIVTLNLTVFESDTTSLEATSCNSYEWNGHVYYQSGVYYSYEQNAHGCDSVIKLNLNIGNTTIYPVETVHTCSNNYLWHGQYYTQDGLYYDTIYDAAGCEEIYSLNLSLSEAYHFNLTDTVCDRYPWPSAEGGYLTETGLYHYEGTTVLGCDSIVDLDLTVGKTPDLHIVGLTIVEVASDVCPGIYNYFISDSLELAQCTVQWSCSEPQWMLLPNSNPYCCTVIVRTLGSAELKATAFCPSGCDDEYTIEIFSSNIGVGEVDENKVKVYPNPANDVVNIEANYIDRIEMYDVYGQLVKELHLDKAASATINTCDLQGGIYFIEVSAVDRKIVERVIISK